MTKFKEWILNVLPTIWGTIWMLIITLASLSVLVSATKWFLRVLELI